MATEDNTNLDFGKLGNDLNKAYQDMDKPQRMTFFALVGLVLWSFIESPLELVLTIVVGIFGFLFGKNQSNK